MPSSYSLGKNEITEFINMKIPRDSKVLDVGPGWGCYGQILKHNYTVDCIEIFPRYVEQFNLKQIYNKVIIGDICDFDYQEYDFIVMGDVLEHIEKNKAINLINQMNNKNKKIMVAVPYQYKQGEYEGNIHETHLQDDLTHEIVLQRYPCLKLRVDCKIYGYYTNF